MYRRAEHRNRALGVIICAFIVFPASLGAARAQTGAPGSDADLLARADAYWKARVAGSDDVASFYPPDTDAKHTERANVSFSNYEVKGVEVTGTTAVVRVQANMAFAVPPQFARIPDRVLRPLIAEAWDRIDGVWYKRPVTGGIARFMRRGPKDGASAPASGDSAASSSSDPVQQAKDAEEPSRD